ncbi:RnfH family protein [Massilia cavernae]|uniref:UPF0125 protein D3872_07865 n=1 Tax=Massilia cavernae TaxID=2320864 RepID=A0A418Y4N1_9BURK|nr:RnfH family protein [Massilia cavernae]RJG20814.1 RnfH family protein [Massilia cavernae]
MADLVNVQVCYATAACEIFRDVSVEVGSTIEQAIAKSGVLEDFPGIDLAVQPVGIFGKKKALDTVVRELDRIEIYRALVADPKDSRRRRAHKKAAEAQE